MIVKVGASSANLGPGFDCFGLAWRLYNAMEFTPSGTLLIEGCDERYKNADNLAYAAYAAALAAAGRGAQPVRIRFLQSDIPVSRGLGSSAALIVGGVLAANELNALGLSGDELFSVASAVEGHPDNVAPALFGGLTASVMDGDRAVTARFALSAAWRFTVLIPDFELSTRLARSVLPASVARGDAVYNVSRSALLLKALETGDAGLLALGLQDRLHQPYRSPLIPGYDRAQALALELGAAGVCISGAGSTVLCFSTDEGFSEKMKDAMGEELPKWRVLAVEPDTEGAVTDSSI